MPTLTGFTPPPQANRKKPVIDMVINDWLGGYVSFTDSTRTRRNSLVQMLNMDLVQNGAARPRPGMKKWGGNAIGEIIGIGTFVVDSPFSNPEKWEISMQAANGVGKIYVRKDGGAWIGRGGSYDAQAWTTFTQTNQRVYINNGRNVMSYYDTKTGAIVSYDPVNAPSGIQVSGSTNLIGSGTIVTYRIRVSSNNKVGESKASPAVTIALKKYREEWDPASDYININHPRVTGASSYNYYIGLADGNEMFLGNLPDPGSGTSVTYRDNNRIMLNPYKVAPEADSTAGPVVNAMINSNGQLFAVQDQNNHYRYWYSGAAEKSGDFSPFSGGGWIDVNLGGESVPVGVKAFRDARGPGVISILTKGPAGLGELYHQTFESANIGESQVIERPIIVMANNNCGAFNAMSIISAKDSLWYPSLGAFKTTGTKPSMLNVLVTDSVSDTIAPDLKKININAMDGACGCELEENRLYWALPVDSDQNSQIWILDLSLGGVWILPWEIPAKFLWKYEDNNGKVHRCALVKNQIMEFDRSCLTNDNGLPFKTRLTSPGLPFDSSGLQVASVDDIKFSIIRPRGSISFNGFGLNEDGDLLSNISQVSQTFKNDPISWDAFVWDEKLWDIDNDLPPQILREYQGKKIEVDELMVQIGYEIATETTGCDYTLNAVRIDGKIIPNLIYGDE